MHTVIGLMSGTSMDGVDVAVLETDGEVVAGFGPTLFRPYAESDRDILRWALAEAGALADRDARPGVLAEAERLVTDAHAEAVERFLTGNPKLSPDLVGFHGQTVFHAPARRLTVQIGDGKALATRLGLPVAYDFRAADVAAGGEGAPFVPVYHRALVARAGLAGHVAVVNIGGVANFTLIGPDGSLKAGDTGPGNALIDDLMKARTGEAMDRGGAHALRGNVDRVVLDRLLADPWFAKPFPKSLDRNAFSGAAVADLSLEDAAATLAAYTGETIARGLKLAGGADTIVVAGGGVHNPAILKQLEAASGGRVLRSYDLGWDGDFIEAQAFAFLAARSLRGLPLSFPETTGVPHPMPGGVLAKP